MLTRIEILNYKSIAQTALDLNQETIIVGPNGVGKSNLLDAIHFIRDAAVDGLDHAITKRHGIGSIRRWSKTRPYHISIKMVFQSGGESGEYRTSISSAGGDFTVVEEEGSWLGKPTVNLTGDEDEEKIVPVTYSFKRKSDHSLMLEMPNTPFGSTLELSVHESELALSQFGGSSLTILSIFFSKLYDEIANCGAYSIYPNKIREPQTLSNSEVLADDGTNLASIIRQMRGSFRSNKESLVSAIKQVLPIVTEIQVKTAGGFYVPVFKVSEIDSGPQHELNMSQISDGTLRMLGMLTAFYQPKAPSRITLEEPEQMIHPGLLPVLVESSRDYLEEKVDKRQLLITTHSPSLLDMFKADDILAASYEDGVSTFAPIAERQLELIKDNLFTAGELLVREGIFQ